jgi:hypothetical protein
LKGTQVRRITAEEKAVMQAQSDDAEAGCLKYRWCGVLGFVRAGGRVSAGDLARAGRAAADGSR